MSMDRVLVIPGSASQIPLIKKLKKDDYEVVCVNPDTEALGIQLADYRVEGDILDKDNCARVGKCYGVKAVVSDECDIAMPVVAYLGEKLGLSTLTGKDAELYTDKTKMRSFCQENGFACPEFQACHTVEEAVHFWRAHGFKKMIIKPIDSNSSRGVFTVCSEEELKSKFSESMSFSRKEKIVLCERYIEGVEFTVDGIMTGNKHYSLAISEKKHYQYNPNIACELFFSYKNPIFDYDQLRKINDVYVEKTQLKFGFTHAEYKYENGIYYLIEIGARGGGNFISSHIVPLLTEFDNYEYLIKRSLGKEYRLENINFWPDKERCAVLKFFDVDEEGYVKEIDNLDLLLNNPKVILYEFRFKKGDYISKAENDSKRVGFYIAWEENDEKLRKLMQVIEEKVKIRVR